jgi:hypothetical protein
MWTKKGSGERQFVRAFFMSNHLNLPAAPRLKREETPRTPTIREIERLDDLVDEAVWTAWRASICRHWGLPNEEQP